MLDAFRPDRRGPAKPTRDDVGADRDVPILYVGLAIFALSVASAFFFGSFAAQGPFANVLILFSIVVAVLTAIFGLLMATACGYMAGLLGSSSSPISGIGILTVMLVAVGLSLVPGVPADEGATRFIAAFALFVTSFIVTTCSIANDNLQDLKTGHMIGATPWKQQVALAIGVVIGAVTVGPILQILYDAYGFVGAFPHAGMNPANALPAPQATLITQIAQGIVEHHLNWTMVTIGALLGVGFVVAEVLLGRVGFSLPAMTVGIGVYLPFDVVLTIALGGVLGWLTEQAFARGTRSDEARDAGRRRGVLAASGFLVGEKPCRDRHRDVGCMGRPQRLAGLGVASPWRGPGCVGRSGLCRHPRGVLPQRREIAASVGLVRARDKKGSAARTKRKRIAQCARIASSSSATMLVILIAGFTAGPAVSL